MAGSAIIYQQSGALVNSKMQEIAARFGSAQPALEIIGETLTASVMRNFEKGGRPDGWEPLAEATLAVKKGGSILVGKGHAGGLLGSIHYQAEETVVYVGTDKIYGAIHQFGGMAGPGRKVEIPQREYLLVQPEDEEEFLAALNDFLLTGEI